MSRDFDGGKRGATGRGDENKEGKGRRRERGITSQWMYETVGRPESFLEVRMDRICSMKSGLSVDPLLY